MISPVLETSTASPVCHPRGERDRFPSPCQRCAPNGAELSPCQVRRTNLILMQLKTSPLQCDPRYTMKHIMLRIYGFAGTIQFPFLAVFCGVTLCSQHPPSFLPTSLHLFAYPLSFPVRQPSQVQVAVPVKKKEKEATGLSRSLAQMAKHQ